MKRVNLALTSWVHLRCLPPFLSFLLFFEMAAELYGILDCCHSIIWKCCCSVAKSYLSLCKLMDCGTPGSSVFHYLLEFVQIHVHWVGDTIQPSHPLSTPSLPSFNLSQYQGLFQWVSSSHQVAKVLKLQLFSISPSNEYSGLISFRIDWFDLLAVQGTLKSLLQHPS